MSATLLLLIKYDRCVCVSVVRFDVMLEDDIVLGLLCLLFLFSIKYDSIVSVVCVCVLVL